MRQAASMAMLSVLFGGQAWAAGWVRDGAVTLTYPSGHWSSSPVTDLLGTEPSPTTDVLVAMGWWYRVEGDTREHPLPSPDSETYSIDGRLVAVWNDLDGRGFRAEEETFVFDNEGPSGAVRTRLFVTNNGAAARTFTAFHYVDPSANGTAGGDSGQLLASAFLKFTDGAAAVRYSAPYASAWMVRPAPQIRDALNDAGLTSLDNSGLPAGPADLEAALSWELTMQPGGGGLYEVQLSSRLPSDHVTGAYRSFSPQVGLIYRTASGPGWYHQDFRHTTALVGESLGAAEPPGYELAALDDLDGDLRDDSLGRNPLTGEMVLNYWTPVTGAPPPPANWRLSATADFDADGRADLLWRNVDSQKLVVWFMNGATRVRAQAPTPDQAAHANWAVAGAADFDGDGWNDILWYNQTSGNIVIWHMDGALQRITGEFTNPTTVGSVAWRVVAVGDFGRGAGAGATWNTTDIVWQNDVSRRIVVWHMDHAATRTSGLFTTPDSLGPSATILGPR